MYRFLKKILFPHAGIIHVMVKILSSPHPTPPTLYQSDFVYLYMSIGMENLTGTVNSFEQFYRSLLFKAHKVHANIMGKLHL
jgi:hypothetical protein